MKADIKFLAKYWLVLIVACSFSTVARSQDGYVSGKPRLAYWKVGNQSSTVIVLHGGPAAQHEYLRPEFDLLSSAATVIYYDQRGCGKSESAGTYVWQEHVKDLRRVIKATSKGKRVYLAGSSWGTSLALIYAYKHPEDVKGLILSGTYEWEGKGKLFKSEKYDSRIRPHKQSLSEQTVVMRQTVTGDLKEELISVYREFELYTDAPAFETRHSFVSAPVADSLRRVRTPTLIINGNRKDKDCMIDWADKYLQLLPNSELFTIPYACHDPWISDPERFFIKCRHFIANNQK